MDSPINRLHIAIETLMRNIDQRIEETKETTITKSQAFLLYIISLEGKIKLAKLAERLDVKPSAITVMIDRMENSGYVKRSNDSKDRRTINVELTETGKKQLDEYSHLRNNTFYHYLSKLDAAEIDQLVHLIEKMNEEKPF